MRYLFFVIAVGITGSLTAGVELGVNQDLFLKTEILESSIGYKMSEVKAVGEAEVLSILKTVATEKGFDQLSKLVKKLPEGCQGAMGVGCGYKLYRITAVDASPKFCFAKTYFTNGGFITRTSIYELKKEGVMLFDGYSLKLALNIEDLPDDYHVCKYELATQQLAQ